ncbi:DUF885 domain-containing protein [Simiduia sp. 21SJ11W-1]|uniref:DUF885 domain-containing protein n=1 Tax=Simiduia sp. 21SJ11W-1 TaxID=2909669 RepID=UPI0020A1F9C0|nr:DUF885 domain-containing protein [Simiduia sp. 21SJ11W-1]UTA47108.1 DUF885 domain-containing protein [Simiduia sp. 21SJ11W-1]
MPLFTFTLSRLGPMLAALACTFSLIACTGPGQKAGATETSNTHQIPAASAALGAIIDDHWRYSLAEDPIMASRMGIAGYAHALPGVTQADRARRLAAELALVARLDAIDTQSLSQTEAVNHQLLRWVLSNSIDANKLFLERIPLNTFYSFYAEALEASSGLAMQTEQDYRNYISRIEAFGRYFDENLANMREGIRTGFVLPKIVVQGIAPTVRAQVYKDPTQSSLYKPFSELPTSLSAKTRKQLQADGARAIAEVAMPAFKRVADFLEGEYLQAATETLGASQLPGGQAYYRHAIRTYVTLDESPDKIHAIGLAEVARIKAEMQALIKATDFEGSFEDFTEFLRTDPKFYATTPEQLLKEAAFIAKRADYQLPAFFKKLPRMSYGIVPVPAEIAPNYTTASYNPAAIGGVRGGAYWLNTHNLNQRPLYELPALTLHEAVPGHHLQGALSQELEDVPHFRRNLYLSAFGEGWGLYAEHLGIEMGMYTTPYEHFGRLSYEMWRACRLVIDTGIHSQGWSRAQALAYLAANTSLSQDNVRAEVDRYISWPGQALSYKMGEIKIRALRAEAERQLGARFDIRDFHDALLSDGALPLSMLEEKMRRFIERHKH